MFLDKLILQILEYELRGLFLKLCVLLESKRASTEGKDEKEYNQESKCGTNHFYLNII